MKQKTKSILAGLSMGLASGAGLACVGIAIWSISNMSHPYINQWVDLAKEKFDPIVSPVTVDAIKQTLHLKPEEQLTPKMVQQFYCDKLTKTPEIFVEDLLKGEAKTAEDCNINRVRISDPTIRYNEEKNKYFLSFIWDQTVYFKSGELEGKQAEWKVHFNNLTFVPSKPEGRQWTVQFDLKTDEEWTATWTFNYCVGFEGTYGEWWKEASGKTFNYSNFENYIKNPFFYEFNFDSWYLSDIN